jgi:hypothetical protein
MAAPHTREELLEALASERAALLDLLPRFTAEQWHSAMRDDGWTAQDIAMHLADANYGLALMTLGEIASPMKLDPATNWMAGLDEYNESRRAKNATLPADKVFSRSAKALDEARRAIETVDDLEAPGPLGPAHTKRQWLQRIVAHTRMHRTDLEQLLG